MASYLLLVSYLHESITDQVHPTIQRGVPRDCSSTDAAIVDSQLDDCFGNLVPATPLESGAIISNRAAGPVLPAFSGTTIPRWPPSDIHALTTQPTVVTHCTGASTFPAWPYFHGTSPG